MENKPSVGQFVAEQLSTGKRRVAKTRNSAGYTSLYPETARAVLAEYPEISVAQKQVVLGTLKDDADRARVITNQDMSAGIRSAARILGAPFRSL
jgi:hypothetical protein